jgi:hypothetical protein
VNEAPAAELQVETADTIISSVDAADDDEAGEPVDVHIAPRPSPRRAPRLSPPIVPDIDEDVVEGDAAEPSEYADADDVQYDADDVQYDADDHHADADDQQDDADDDRDDQDDGIHLPDVPSRPGPGPEVPVAPAELRAVPIDMPPQPPPAAEEQEEQADQEEQMDTADVLTAAERLRRHAATLSLTLDVEGVTAARKEREALVSQLDDYLLPRLRRRDAPLLAVIGGSTGAGKSTLTNSIVRREVSRSGVLRPTTRSPVLVHHPFDSGAFLSQRILPRLTRVTSEAPEPLQPIDPNAPRITGLRLVPHDGMAPGMAIIDAPDIDSLVQTNRDLAVQLLQAADLWLFVTTAARYADAMPWQMLRQAAERGVAIAVLLDRVPPEALADLRVHLATKLRDRGLGGAPMFVIPETETVDGFLPERVVAPLKQWLRRVAADDSSRRVIASRTLKGVLGSLPERALVLADAADAQARAWQVLEQDVDAVFEPIRERLLSTMIDGSLVSGEVLTRWQEFVAEGELVRRLDGGHGTIAERLSAAVQREGEVAQPLDVPVTSAATTAIRAAVQAAREAVLARWRQRPFGASLLEARGHQIRGGNPEATLERTVRDWRAGVSAAVAGVVQEANVGDDTTVDEEIAADVLFIVAIDERSDRGEGDPGVVTVAAARRILGSLVGEEPVRSLTADARADLVARAAVVLDAERQRLEKLLSGSVTNARGQALRIASAVLKDAR